MSQLMMKHDFLLKASDFSNLLKLVILELKNRSKLWINKLDVLDKKLSEAISSFINKKIKKFSEISDFLKGDDEKLINSF
jgi:hypothetical protein